MNVYVIYKHSSPESGLKPVALDIVTAENAEFVRCYIEARYIPMQKYKDQKFTIKRCELLEITETVIEEAKTHADKYNAALSELEALEDILKPKFTKDSI